MTRTLEYLTIIGGLVSILGVLMRIAWLNGQLVQRIDDHIKLDERIQADQENRIRTLERRRKGPQPPWA